MEPAAQDIREQVGRLLGSVAISRSESTRRLLGYLCEKSLAGEADSLKEYAVGVDAFGKPPNYDPRQDSIVRFQASRLRQKINEYYQTEGKSDPIAIDFPKGGFKLVFRRQSADSSEDLQASLTRWRRYALALGIGALALLLWAGLATARLLRQPTEATAAAAVWTDDLEALWSPFLTSRRPLLLSIGTPFFVKVRGFGFLRQTMVNDLEHAQKSPQLLSIVQALKAAGMVPWQAYTGAGEAGAVFHVSKLLGARRPDLLFTRSSSLSWEGISDHNLIFIGPPKFNIHLMNIPVEPAFVFDHQGVVNLRPAPGEPPSFPDEFDPERSQDGVTNAVISHFPGLHGHGEILVLAGNAGPDTLAAAQWITQPRYATELVAKLKEPSGKLPPYYQVVIRAEFKNHVPVKTSYVCHRILDVAGQSAAR
jgi:hypothetical protein